MAHAQAEAAAGDESWGQWVEEFQRGDALILRLELTLEISDAVVRGSTNGLFVENDVHAPKVEQQVAELASGDFAALAGTLAARGHDIDVYELCEMYIHVELDPEVRRRLANSSAIARSSDRRPPAPEAQG